MPAPESRTPVHQSRALRSDLPYRAPQRLAGGRRDGLCTVSAALNVTEPR